MPQQVSDFSPSERKHLDKLKVRHDAVEAKEKARAARQKEKTAQHSPKQDKQPVNTGNEKMRRAPSKAKESLRSDCVKRYHGATKDDKKIRQLDKEIDERPPKPRQDFETPKRPDRDLEKLHHARSKDGEKQEHVKERGKDVSRHGSGKTPYLVPYASIETENATPMPRTTTSAHRPERRSSKSSSSVKGSAVTKELRDKKHGSAVDEAAARPEKASQSSAKEEVRPSLTRALSIITEMPGTFTEYSGSSHLTTTPSTKIVVSELPKAAPVAPAVAEPPRALFHINGPLINLNFNLWGK